MNPKLLVAYAKAMRKHGITSFRADGVEIIIDLHATAPTRLPNTAPSPHAIVDTDEMSPEDIALWSSSPHEPT